MIKGYELLGMGKIERAEQDAIDEREHGGGGADAQGQGENGHDGEAGVMKKAAEGMAYNGHVFNYARDRLIVP